MNCSLLFSRGRAAGHSPNFWLYLLSLLALALPATGQVSVDWEEEPALPGYARASVTGTTTSTGTGGAVGAVFDVEVGDTFTIYMEPDRTSGAPRIRILNPQGSQIASNSGSASGFSRIQNFVATVPGSYTAQFYFDTQPGDFRAFFMRARDLQMESEPNTDEAGATILDFSGTGFTATHRWAGMLDSFDLADTYDLGVLGAGTTLLINLELPTGSSLELDGPVLTLWREGEALPVADSQSGALSHTTTASGNYYLRIATTGPENFLSLDGGGYVDLGNPAELQVTGDQTIEFWMRADDTNARRNPWAKAYAGEGTITLETNNTMNYFYGTGGSNNNPYQGWSNYYAVPDGLWVHHALVRDLTAPSPKLRWYVNGTLWSEVDATYPLAASGPLNAYIGQGYVSRLVGALSEVRHWSRALTGAEIQDGMDKSVSGLADTTNLDAGWDFSSDAGSILTDLSGNGVDGTISGTATIGAAGHAREMTAVQQGWQADYLLSMTVNDTESISVVSTTLPDPGIPTQDLLSSFSIEFSKTLSRPSAEDPVHYDLTGSGPDGTFGTADDVSFTLTPTFDGRETVTLSIVERPLVPDSYTFSINTGLSDRMGNTLGTSFTRVFEVEPVGTFVTETHPNNSFGDATFLSDPGGAFSGSFDILPDTLSVANAIWVLRSADLDEDGVDDLIIVRYNPSELYLYRGLGSGQFDTPVIIALPGQGYDLELGDFFGTGRTDIAVSCRSGSRIQVYENTGNADFSLRMALAADVPVTTNPIQLDSGDFNNDSRLDLVTAHSGNLVSVLLNDGAGGFTVSTIDTLVGNCHGVAAGDLDKDGNEDIVVSHRAARQVQILRGDGTGGFAPDGIYAVSTSNRDAEFIELADLNGNGELDLVMAYYYNDGFDLFEGDGAGGFLPVQKIGLGGFRYQQQVRFVEGTGSVPNLILLGGSDGPAIIQSHPAASGFSISTLIYTGQGDTYGLDLIDLDGDPHPDLAMAAYSQNVVRFARGLVNNPLPDDTNVPDVLEYGHGRGLILSGENDYFRFSIDEPRRVIIAAETLRPDVYYSRCRIRFYNSNNIQIGTFVTGVSGGENQGNYYIAYPGVYTVRVEQYDAFDTEYRFRVSLVDPSYQLESEGNDSQAAADGLSFGPPSPELPLQDQLADIWGYQDTGDTNGDYFLLPNLGTGAELSMDLSLPVHSPLNPSISVYDGTGTELLDGALGVLSQTFTISEPLAPPYYVRIESEGATRGLLSEYGLVVGISDTTPPTITANSLPAAPGISLPNIFTLTFDEDMLASTVNDIANYEMRGAGPDDLLDTADDTFFSVRLWTSYSSGLSSTLYLPDGPLPADTYRFTAFAGIMDRFGNNLAADYTHEFELLAVDPFVLETEANNSGTSANQLGPPLPQFGGSFSLGSTAAPTRDSPWRIVSADFNNDTHPDVAVTTWADYLQVYLNDGSGGFSAPVDFALGGEPRDLTIGDWNGDNRPDLVVGLYNVGQVRFFLNTGDDSGGPATLFTEGVTITTGGQPHQLAAGNFNGDAHEDVLVAGYTDNSVHLLAGDGTGAFTVTTTAVPARPVGLVAGDFTGNGHSDFVAGMYNTRTVYLYEGDGAGNFTQVQQLSPSTSNRNPYFFDTDDINDDGIADLVLAYDYNRVIDYFLGNVGGTFEPVQTFDIGGFVYQYSVRLSDINADGHPELFIGQSNGTRFALGTGSSSQPFTGGVYYNLNASYDVAIDDFNRDGFPDVLVSNYNEDRLFLLPGDPVLDIPSEPGDINMNLATGRGYVADTNDVDYYSFYAEAGDRIQVLAQSISSVYYSRVRVYVYNPGEQQILNFITNVSGGTNQSQFTASVSGHHYVRVQQYDNYNGEYRFRVSVVKEAVQLESENNNSVGNADSLSFNEEGNDSVARIFGALPPNDTNGDYFAIGNLGTGTLVSLSLRLPDVGTVIPVLELRNAGGTVVASSTPGDTLLEYTIPPDSGGNYTARIYGEGSSEDFFSQYLLTVSLADNTPPIITADTLPEEGLGHSIITDRFTLNFSEDMLASSVNDTAAYDLRSSGPDGLFDTADDGLYSVALLSSYSSGLSASYWVTDGPLQPGVYRFRAGTTIQDLAENPLAATYQRSWEILAVDGVPLESRDNDTFETADLLSTLLDPAFDGSYARTDTLIPAGDGPWMMADGDFNMDGFPDVAVIIYNSGLLRLYPGMADGTFDDPIEWSTGSQPYFILSGDWNKDGRPDLAIPHWNTDYLSVYLNIDDPQVFSRTDFTIGNNQRQVASGDVNGDTHPDLLVTRENAGEVVLLLGDGTGNFATSSLAVGGRPVGLTIDDFNGDTLDDLAVCSRLSPSSMTHYVNLGNAVFEEVATYTYDRQPFFMDSGDLDGDNIPDVVVGFEYRNAALLYPGGNGSFGAPLDIGYGRWTYSYNSRIVDVDLDGKPDIVSGGQTTPGLTVNFNHSEPGMFAFSSALGHPAAQNAYDAAVLQWPGQNPVFVIAAYDQDQLHFLRGNGIKQLDPDPTEAAIREYAVRGNMASNSDLDYWTFSANAGERLILTSEQISGTYYSRKRFRVYDANGSELSTFTNAINNQQHQSNGIYLPYTGTYFIRVENYDQNRAEYRMQLLLFANEVSLESESNNNTGQADPISFGWNNQPDQALIGGVIIMEDSSGDYFNNGNLGEGTTITVTPRSIDTSDLQPRIQIRDAANTVVNESTGTAASWTIPGGSGGNIYVRVFDDQANRNLDSTYILEVDIADTQAPEITQTSLPGEPSSELITSFSLDFSEDMQADTVRDAASYELRRAAVPGTWGPEDTILTVTPGNYTSGLSNSYTITEIPLVPGEYRLLVDTALTDRWGNPMDAPFIHEFTILGVDGYDNEIWPNNSNEDASPINLTEGQPDLLVGGGRGRMENNSDVDYWSFDALAGDELILDGQNPVYSAYYSRLRWILKAPDGTEIINYISGINGAFDPRRVTLDQDGTHILVVNRYDNYLGEYRFRLFRSTNGMQMETEPNNTIGEGNTLVLESIGENATAATIAGYTRTTGDFEYFDLGTVDPGYSIFLSVRKPQDSPLNPVVAVYREDNVFMNEAPGGRTGDPVAEVRITDSARYYALVRPSGATGGLFSTYLLDVQIAPTELVAFPNLIPGPVSVTLPDPFESGDSFDYAVSIENAGSQDIASGGWSDKIVLSTNTVIGDADDILLDGIVKTGGLTSGSSYLLSGTALIPDGLSGDFYLGVMTDSLNFVNEFLFEGDNTSVTETAFTIALRDYPDLVVENLSVSAIPDSSDWEITWDLANRGTAATPATHSQRLLVTKVNTAEVLLNEEIAVGTSIAVDGTLPYTRTVTASAGGTYRVRVIADVLNDVYEFNGLGHLAAEQNTAETSFNITSFYTIGAIASPTEGGSVTGAGVYAEGSPVTLNATADTSTLPYFFSRWSEGGGFVSADAEYTFTATRDRDLVAEFLLPTYPVTASVDPAGSGSVTGTGTYQHGSPVSLQANPSAGYLFSHWSESGSLVSADNPYTFTAESARTLVAHFDEANPEHEVTITTSPEGVATIGGGGTFGNGLNLLIDAPQSVIDGDVEYLFQRFLLNGTVFSLDASLNVLLTTAFPATMEFVAEYTSRSLKPEVVNAYGSKDSPLPLGTEYQLTVVFDRAMDTGIGPVGTLLSDDAPVPATMPAGGSWLNSSTFRFPAVTISPDSGGTYRLQVSGATDLDSRVMDAAEVFTFVADTTPPPAVTPVLSTYTETSATLEWNGYTPPADLQSFRVFIETGTFASTDGLTAVAAPAGSARQVVLHGLTLDQPYFGAVVAVDSAGNGLTDVTPLAFTMSSDVPDPVDLVVRATGPGEATLDWTAYPESNYRGLAGYMVYMEDAPFISVLGLTEIDDIPAGTQELVVEGLDRTTTHDFAVVAYNRLDEFNPDVVSRQWEDPLSGTISESIVLGPEPVEILQPLTVTSGADLTLLPGTILRFAPGASLEIADGRLLASGTPIEPILLTSLNDTPGNGSPMAGDWGSLILSDPSRASVMDHFAVRFGQGMRIEGAEPSLGLVSILNNSGSGITVESGSSLTGGPFLIDGNDTGVLLRSGAQATVNNSVIKNNTLQVNVEGSAANDFSSNWWGSSDPATIAAGLLGVVNTAPALGSEPVLSAAIANAAGDGTTGVRDIDLLIASLNAESYRLSEDSTFTGVLFEDMPLDPRTGGVFRLDPATVPFQLSESAGLKTVFAQFRSLTGELSTPVEIDIEYITDGPVITAFNLTEGQEIERPVRIQSTATAVLGMQTLRFQVDGADVISVGGGTIDETWDMRLLTPGVHRVGVLATDFAGNTASREINVILSPRPPDQPVILDPVDGALLNTTPIPVTGTAEPGIDLRLSRNGATLGTTTATPGGTFTFPAATLVEGLNSLVVTATDVLGDTPSPIVDVNLDTVAPAALILEPPTFDPDQGLQLLWRYPETGKRASTFQVLWNSTSFTTPGEASGQSTDLDVMQYYLNGVADGAYFIGVVGYDAAGNVSEVSNLVEYTYDGSAPVLTIEYDKSMPVGPGDLGIIVTSGEPLLGTPTLSIQPAGMPSPISVPLAEDSPQAFSGIFPVSDLSARSGTAQVRMSARDLRGNAFSGTPFGEPLVFDVTRPTGIIGVSEPAPIQTTTPVILNVGLTLTKPPVAGSTPTLTFSPPLGDVIDITLTGADTSWSGSMTLGPAQGDGFGSFLMQVTDSAGNTGTTITDGLELELYTGDFPTPPDRPQSLEAQTLPGGDIRITWDPVPLAESYAIYREVGNAEDPPEALLIDGLGGTEFTDSPPADGIWSYVITADRRGAEGLPSGILPALSDRTPPGAPTDVTATLLNQGVAVEWIAPGGEVPAQYKVYRNGSVIRQVQTAAGITDAPPRGLMNYQIAAVDPYGNEALSTGAELELFVDAVNNLTATLSEGEGPLLTWNSSDPTAVGFHVDRDGLRLTTDPVAQPFYTDPAPPTDASVQYAVRAINAEDQESAPRLVTVYPFTMDIMVNPDATGTESAPSAFFFDRYDLDLTNLAGDQPMPVQLLRAERTQAAVGPVSQDWPVNWSVNPSEMAEASLVLPATTVRGTLQELRVRAIAGPDEGGSSAIYQKTVGVLDSIIPTGMITLSVDQAPLAGGLTEFTATLHNRGYADMDVLYSRASGSETGDIYISILDENDVEVNRHYTTGLTDGLIFRPNGDGILRIAPGDFISIPVPDVLVPESLGENGFARFVAVAEPIFNDTGLATQQQAGPISGEITSDLTQTPYYGSSQTAQQVYANDDLIELTGQALDRDTNNPVPDVPLKIGIASGGFRWFEEVTTDSNGDYTFTYEPQPGFSGELNFWACHPDIFDTLEQTLVRFYRLYITPSIADIVMSRSDTLDFSLQVINPGDIELSGFTLETRAFTLEDETEVLTDKVSVDFNGTPPATMRARERKSFNFRLQADLDAPEDPIVEFVLSTSEGASTGFRGRISLRPAVPVLSVTSPENGYVDVSVNRGELISREVTVKNLGLRPLEGVEIIPPASLDWFQVNLPRNEEGRILWPDIPVGGTQTFTVVFTPPEENELGYFNDFLLITGTNAVSDFQLNLFAQVTSSESGSVQFYVDNILVDPVPNASIRLRNTVLRQEVGPFLTDASGNVTIDNLQEGEWSWQVIASGHSTNTGTVEVVPDQTALVETRLSRSLVTVNFSVVPKPFTDRYEIVIEQTFETHVPFPVLVLSPPNFEFTNPEPGFETIVIVEAKNEGLISLFDGEIEGTVAEWGTLTPLITYIPELRAQEVIEVPMRVKFVGRNGEGAGGDYIQGELSAPESWGSNFGNCLSTLLIPNSLSPDVLLGLAAIMNAAAECADGVAAAAAASVLVGFDIFSAVSTLANPFAVLATVVGCAIGSLFAGGGGGGSSGGGGPSGGTGVGFSGDGCFPEYALVEMVDGSMLPISDVEVGMWVRTGDSRLEKALVTETITMVSDHLYSYDLVSLTDPDNQMTFKVTGEHRVWTHREGWQAAMNLKAGDLLVGRNGERFLVRSGHRDESTHAVFTLELDNANALYVDGILVQDLCGGLFLESETSSDASPQP